jgi:hypothetical protein
MALQQKQCVPCGFAVVALTNSNAANPDTVEMTAHPSITGWKTAPRASGADAAASVLFHDSGGIMLSGVAELGVFSIQMEIRPKRNVATRLLA